MAPYVFPGLILIQAIKILSKENHMNNQVFVKGQNYFYTANLISSRKLTDEEMSILRSTIEGAIMDYMSGVGVMDVEENKSDQEEKLSS